MGRLVVVGSSNTDMILQLPRLPQAGETVLAGRASTAAGGKGANQAVAAARTDTEVSLVARVGKDSFGEHALAGFSADGIDTRFCSVDEDTPSGIAQIFVSASGENCIGVAPGANATLSPAHIEAAAEAFSGAKVVLLQLEIPLASVEHAAALGRSSDALVILNPAPACELPDSIWSLVDIITPNETEAELLTGVRIETVHDADAAADVLHSKGVPTVLITLGEKGVYLSTREGSTAAPSRMFPAFKATAVDTTAAGDVFNGCLAAALTRGETLEWSVNFAQAAAALSIQTLGAQNSAPVIGDIDSFLESR
ncbi:MAG: ribokinase [Halieaceae bacterium]|jgi:ribokinase|nr:ribokinase [Halieaceae bacterium]